jgi:nucleoside-diphosphate-sugar epimerase
VVGAGQNMMHPIYIDDVIDGMLRWLETPARPGSVYNLVGQRALPIVELAQAMAHALGTGLPREHLPVWLVRAMAAVCEALPVPAERLPLSQHHVEFMLQNWAYLGERARNELGFVPRVDLETGLQRTVDWYRSEGWL